MFYISGIHGSQTLYTAPTTSSPSLHPVTKVESIAGQSAVESDHSSSNESSLAQHSPLKNPYAHLDETPPERKPAVIASQIMSSPAITLAAHESIEHAWKLFHAKQFRHLPVISEEGKLIGILSDRDFLALGLNYVGRELHPSKDLVTPVKEVMTTDVLTARPTTEIRAIAKIMFSEKISAMPIVNEEGELVGILTTSDILRTIINYAPLELWT